MTVMTICQAKLVARTPAAHHTHDLTNALAVLLTEVDRHESIDLERARLRAHAMRVTRAAS